MSQDTVRGSRSGVSVPTLAAMVVGAMVGGPAIDRWGADGGQAVAIIGGALAIAVAAVGLPRLAQMETRNPA